MPWFPVDDSFYSHPKALAASLAARGLWVTAGSWSSAHLTDGVVPVHVLGLLGGTPELAAELVAAGLWKRTRRGYVFHDWLEWGSKRTAAETLELRAVRAENGRKGGQASGRSRKVKGSNSLKQEASKPGLLRPSNGSESDHHTTDEQGERPSKTEATSKQVASQLVAGGLNPQSLYTHTALSQPEPFLRARDPKGNFPDVKSNSQANRLPSARPLNEALRDAGVPADNQPASEETKTAAAAQARQKLNGRTT